MQMVMKPEGKDFTCDECGRVFPSGWQLKMHGDSHKTTEAEKFGRFNCTVCHRRFPTKGRLDRHASAVHEKKLCPQCPLRFDDFASLRKHRAAVHTSVHSCLLCDSSFRRKADLIRHNTSAFHLKRVPKPAHCPVKGCFLKEQLEPADLAAHVNSVHGNAETSGSTGKAPSTDRTTVDTITADVERHRCPECGRQYSQSRYLTKHHNRVHKGIKEKRPETLYTCSVCSKSFAIKAKWETHMNRHSGATPYQCQFCDKRYPGSEGLRHHMKLKHADRVH